MPTEELTIRVDPEAAAIYRNADEQQRRKYDLLLDLHLRSLARDQWLTHEQKVEALLCATKELGEEAQRRGLTPEILQSILNDEP